MEMEEDADKAVTMDEEAEDPYGDFLIVDLNYSKGQNPPYYTLLLDSASFSDYEVDFIFNKTQEKFSHEYSVTIKGIPEEFPTGCSNDKRWAQNLASEKALKILSQHCYTVKYKNHPEPVTLEHILEKGSMEVTVSAIQSSNCSALEEASNPSPGDLVPERAFSNIAIRDSYVNDTQVFQSSREQNCHQGMEVDMSCPKTHFDGTSSENRGVVQLGPLCDNLDKIGKASFSPHNEVSSAYVLPDTFGSKMMKMMGWKGGGLGRDGCGITEPVRSSLVQGRFGFGHTKRKEVEASVLTVNAKGKIVKKKQKKMKNQAAKVQSSVSLRKICDDRFKSGARAIIREFCENSKDQELLMFSRKLSPLQRKTVHEIAPEYSLSSNSFGIGGFRHLILFRDHSTYDFLERLRDLAKENKQVQFEIIPPSQAQS